MAKEEEIKKLAHAIWEAEGCPEGQHLDHYFRARCMLEDQEEIQSYINRMHIHPASRPIGRPVPQEKRYW
jgi:hypothetical protein